MRLSVFLANTLSSQLIIDLQKLYVNYLTEDLLTQQSIQKELEDSSSQLYVTMFNERHLGAIKVQIEDKNATLSQLCVREVTRRRGVGKNLLKEVEKQLIIEGVENIQYDLREALQEEYLITQAFMSNSGYKLKGHIATKTL